MWVREDVDRWTWTGDDSVHLLLHAGGHMWELHHRYVHRYVPAEEFPPDLPLEGAQHRDTQVFDEGPADDEAGWQRLAELAGA